MRDAQVRVNVAAMFVVVFLGGGQCYNYLVEDLSRYCDNRLWTLTLPYPNFPTYDAGTVELQNSPSANCSFHIVVNDRTSIYMYEPTQYAIYFNIRDLNLYPGDRVDIIEVKYPTNTSTTVKSYNGSYDETVTKHIRPTSVDQFLSPYSERPQLGVYFYKSETHDSYGTRTFRVDYTILRKNFYYPVNSYCKALDGYIPSALACEQEDRVNCPSHYNASAQAAVTTMDSVTSTEQRSSRSECDVATTIAYIPSYVTSSLRNESSGSGGFMVGIIIVSVVLIVVFLLCLLCHRHYRMKSERQRTPPVRVHNLQGTPTVVLPTTNAVIGAFVPASELSSRELGAPPPYKELFPSA